MSTSPVAARILHVTDPHLFADADGSLRGVVTHTTLTAVIDHISRTQWPADMVAMTGDVIQDDSAEAYVRFREIMKPLGLPVHCVPGNHDVRSLMRDGLSEPPFHYCSSARFGDWLVTGIDSGIENDAAGLVSAEKWSDSGTFLQIPMRHMSRCACTTRPCPWAAGGLTR